MKLNHLLKFRHYYFKKVGQKNKLLSMASLSLKMTSISITKTSNQLKKMFATCYFLFRWYAISLIT